MCFRAQKSIKGDVFDPFDNLDQIEQIYKVERFDRVDKIDEYERFHDSHTYYTGLQILSYYPCSTVSLSRNNYGVKSIHPGYLDCDE